jgi:hypothetical protein
MNRAVQEERLCSETLGIDRRSDLTDEDAVMGIEQLAQEEHTLREADGHRSLTEEEQKRLVWLEKRLDQCWDLLRQRRALKEAGRNPAEASIRSVNTVENYQQ